MTSQLFDVGFADKETTLDAVSDIVKDTLESLPKAFSEKIENVAFLVTDWPTWDQVRELKLSPGYLLFGLYQGVPRTQKPFSYQLHPDRITIFAGPLLSVSKSWNEAKEKIKNTVLHEIAHYFGLSESQIHAIEKDKGIRY